MNAVLLPALLLGPCLGAGSIMLLRKSDATPSLQPPAAPGAEEAIPVPKGSDILWGFIELRKGIFNEKREKVLTNKPVSWDQCWNPSWKGQQGLHARF